MQMLIVIGVFCLVTAVLAKDVETYTSLCQDEGDECKRNGMIECCRNLDCKKSRYGNKRTCQRSDDDSCKPRGKRCRRHSECCNNRRCTRSDRKTCR
ncbi:uncharacterized protein SJCHGC09800-like [Gigantopelta aegis]|uniref:uncharacterized protein SJCHGC09800-like n=1 Tax=Gigantopelta aegis TaxID=1735272 RepID=UPI001B8878E8|nr:uncharacterized protein SJCHGC09800-like [Gigantopelta aegis]